MTTAAIVGGLIYVVVWPLGMGFVRGFRSARLERAA